MPKVSPLQGNFSSGEFSPLLYGRVDSDRYKTGLAVCLNYVPVIQGGMTRRPGSYYAAEVKDSSKKVRLQAFEFSTTQAYMIEFGDQYVRFYKDNAQIVSGTPVEVATPYLEADLFQLKVTQSADILYIAHPNYAPRKLTRTSHTSWTLTTITFLDGPYLPTDSSGTTITPSGTTGAVTLLASAALWSANDVGRLVRLNHGGTWGYARITVFTDTTHVTATVVNAFGGVGATSVWRLGIWTDFLGYPSTVTFHEDRLIWGGAKSYPLRLDGSNSGDYENMAPSKTDGTIIASNAISFSFNANDVNVVRWMTSDEKGLLSGTVGGEWVVKPSAQNEALSPTNITAKRASSHGSANIQPIQAGKATMFIQRSGRIARELTYFFDVDGFRAENVTEIAEHITGNSLTQIAFQKTPQPIIWCVRDDGVLAAMTYERNLESLRVGWSRHVMGGYSDAAQSAAIVESVAVIPSVDGTRDEVWLVVKRYINGTTKRYVEYITRFFDDLTEQKDAFFVDCGLTYDSPKTITAATKANPVVVTSAGHGFSNGDKVLISGVLGMTQLNGNTYIISGVTANTFQLTDVNTGATIDGTAFSTYVSGGKVRKLVSTISGLGHLEGQTISILADGAVQPNQAVSGGAITLSPSAATVQVGLGYNSDAQMLRLEAGSADGTALGKTRRTHRMGMLLHRTLGLKIGTNFDELTTIPFRTGADKMTRAPALYSGIISENFDADYDFENQMCWRQDQPLPGTILAVMPQMVEQDR